MSSAETAYWAAIAQVLPVFGLALVIEGRTLAQAWHRAGGQKGRSAPRVQLWILSGGAVGVVFGTGVAVAALADEKSPPAWSDPLIAIALALSMAGALGSPLLSVLMFTESRSLTRFVNWMTNRDLRKVVRSMGGLHSDYVRMRRDAFDSMLEVENALAHSEALRDRARVLSDPDLARRTEANAATGARIALEARTRWRGLIVMEQNTRLYVRELRSVTKEWSRKEGDAFAAAVLKASDPITGLSGQIKGLVYGHEAPDDGGFFHASPAPPLPRLRNAGERFVTDPADFYSVDA